MKFFTLPIALLLLSASAYAQIAAPCKLVIAPEVRGFKLGMTRAQVQAKLKYNFGIDKPDDIGVSTRSVGPFELVDEQAAKGLSNINLEFLDDRLTYIEINYDGSVKWDSIEQFTDTLSDTLSLPLKWGSPITNTKEVLGISVTATARKLECAGFNAGAIVTSTGPSVLMIGEAGLKAEKDRRRQASKSARQQTFKP